MSPETQAFLLNTVLPAIGIFLAGHFHIVLPVPKSAAPAIRPFGQGGLIDIFGQVAAQIFGSSASSADKVAAVAKLDEAIKIVGKAS